MKPALLPVAVAAVLSAAPASPQDGEKPTAKQQIEASAQKIKELKTQRLAVLKKMTGLFELLCKAKRGHVDELLEARQLLTEAELEAANTEAERIAIHKDLVATLKGYEEMAAARVAAGKAIDAVVLRAKAKRLEAEIRLEQATHPPERAAPPPKDRASVPSKAVKELRKERIAVLKKQVGELTTMFQNARLDYGKLLEAWQLLIEAELDAAETDTERVELCKRLVAFCKVSVEWGQARVAAGRETATAVLRPMAKRLEAEIRLEQAKIAAAKAGK